MAAQDERFRAQHGSEKGQVEERGGELSPSQHACAAADGAESLDDEREAKLKHLARRSKTATMALGRERSKSAQLSAELVSVRRQLADAADGGDSDADLARSLKETKERLSNSERRLHEQKLSQQMLKAEVERYRRALAKEVGEELPLAKLLEEGSGAKGRAQQISLLQEKIRDMSRKLFAATAGAEGGRAAEEEDGPRRNLQAIEQERRNEMDRLLLCEQQLHAQLGEARHKLDAQAARIKNLETDGRSKREQLKLLLDKSDTDDELIRALRAELHKVTGKDDSRQASPTRAGTQQCRESQSQQPTGAQNSQQSVAAADVALAESERRARELSASVVEQQAQIGRQEQIIVALKDELAARSKAEEPRIHEMPLEESHFNSDQTHSDTNLVRENEKLRELVHLLQQKLSSELVHTSSSTAVE